MENLVTDDIRTGSVKRHPRVLEPLTLWLRADKLVFLGGRKNMDQLSIQTSISSYRTWISTRGAMKVEEEKESLYSAEFTSAQFCYLY